MKSLTPVEPGFPEWSVTGRETYKEKKPIVLQEEVLKRLMGCVL